MRELEFLPEDYVRARFQRRIGFIRSWLLLALGLAMVLWSLQMGVWVRDAQAELLSLRSASAAVEGDVSKVRTLRAEAWSCDQRLSLVRTLQSRTTVTDVLHELAAILPDGVTLEDVNLDCSKAKPGARLTLWLRGAAAKETGVTQTLAAIESSKLLERPVLVESKPYSREDSVRRAFVIEVSVVALAQSKER